MLINITNLNLQINIDDFETKQITKNLNLNLNKGDKLCILGKNGSGKTTLLNTIYDKDFSIPSINGTNGQIDLKGKISYLRQVQKIDNDNQTIMDWLVDLSEDWWQIVDKNIEIFETDILDYNQPISSLSGGQLTKILISKALFEASDILIFDEPTNNLDIKSLENLEKCLSSFEGLVVFVSHNLSFIKNVGNCFLDLNSGLFFRGSFEELNTHQESIENTRIKSIKNQEKVIKKLENTIIAQATKSIRGVKGARAKFMEGSIDKLSWGGMKNRPTLSQTNKPKLDKKIDEASLKIDELKEFSKTILKFDTKTKHNTQNKLISLKKGKLIIGDNILIENTNFDINLGERIGIVGENGVGKSLFIKAILGEIVNGISFEYDKLYKNIDLHNIAYIDQKYTILSDQERSVIDFFEEYSGIEGKDARHHLSQFLFFKTQQVNQPIKSLSGGEKVRLCLALILSKPVQLLILDELTNNLDLDTINEIIRSLSNYYGAIITISHDLSFIEKLGCKKTQKMTNHGLKDYNEEK